MALKPNTAPPKDAKKPAPRTWKTTMPGRITKEDADNEPPEDRLFLEA